MSKYSVRSKQTGKFIKLNAQTGNCKCNGSCRSNASPKVVAGRLYDWKGTTVRAFGQVGNERLVMAHKTLAGLVKDCDLKPISKEAVEAYLKEA